MTQRARCTATSPSLTELPASGKASYAYMPALDGFRAISIALVVIGHFGLRDIIPGGLGVMIFFVISGFLITRQMIVEIERTGTLNLGAFYLRRIFRLAPPLLVYIFLFTIILTHLGADITFAHIMSGVFYFSNFYSIFIGFPTHNPIPITWSLSVEEHFYIVFPFLMIAFRRNLKRALPLLLLIVVAVLGWRLYLVNHCYNMGTWLASDGICGRSRDARIHGTDFIFDSILYGAITALILHYHNVIAQRWFIRRRAFIVAIFVLLVTLIYRDPIFRDTIRLTLQSIAIAIVITNTLFNPAMDSPRRSLSLPFMLLLGRMSYSLYLFHYGVLNTIFALQHRTTIIITPLGFISYYVSSALLTVAAYYLIEQPVLKLRKRLGSHIT